MPCLYKYDYAALELSYLNVLYLAIIQYAKMAAILHTALWAGTVHVFQSNFLKALVEKFQ